MTNRRKGSKGKASVSKKAESSEKQSRRLSRRSRRNKKSVSPEEQPEEVGSEYSVDENTEDDEGRGGYDHEKDNNDGFFRESDQYDAVGKSDNDQISQLKEEESGGSDGSWKVKSEDGGSGGIPKLKLCLTRPLDISSPTSEQPSPRRRRRGRGNVSPALLDETAHEGKESPKRSTRSQKSKEMAEPETPVETKPAEVQLEERETVQSEVCDSTNINHSENEDETQMAVDSIIETQKQEETDEIVSQVMENEAEQTRVEPEERKEEAQKERDTEMETEPPRKEVEKVEMVEDRRSVSPRVETVQPRVEEPEEKVPSPKPLSPKEVEEPSEKPVVEEKNTEENVRDREKRSPSRDSSEERAKEAALLSRNKYRKMMSSEQGDAVDSSKSEKSEAASRIEDVDKSVVPAAETKSDMKENQEESVPAKANNRKRRWGASTSRVTKKPPVSISTDFLKEIIPEVKPLPMSEVQLSPNEEEDSQAKESEENIPVITKKVDREKMVQSDESEKDYEEEAVESGAEESLKNESIKAAPQVKEKEFTTFTRKVSVLPSNDINRLQRSPSPPRHKPSNILYIVNLVRPFTIPQLRELLARTGTIAEDGFWIDKIKSRCYVKYETEEEAKTTRHALHGVRWPVSNPKQLNVDFGTEAAMKAAQEGNEIVPKRPMPSLFVKSIEVKSSEKTREREERSRERKEKNDKEKKEIRVKHKEDEKREEEEKEKKVRPAPAEPLARDRTVRRVTVPVREWDVGKNEDGFSPPPDGIEFGRHRDDRYDRRVEYERDKRDEYDDRRRRDKDRGRRSISNEPPRKSKKKNDEEAPAKLLDDLFRKTKATPCIYWLPLTAEQIAVKEELRRKHMAEHEKRVAEMRKIQRDQNKRNSDKRRRRSKSRSRSRSPKK